MVSLVLSLTRLINPVDMYPLIKLVKWAYHKPDNILLKVTRPLPRLIPPAQSHPRLRKADIQRDIHLGKVPDTKLDLLMQRVKLTSLHPNRVIKPDNLATRGHKQAKGLTKLVTPVPMGQHIPPSLLPPHLPPLLPNIHPQPHLPQDNTNPDPLTILQRMVKPHLNMPQGRILLLEPTPWLVELVGVVE